MPRSIGQEADGAHTHRSSDSPAWSRSRCSGLLGLRTTLWIDFLAAFGAVLLTTPWIGLALVASLVSIRLGISVALIEIGMGVLGGNP